MQYLEKHQGSATYLVAVNGSQSAGPFILESGKAVIAMGGFGGSDPAPTLSEFKQLVASGKVHYVYVSGGSGSTAGAGGAGFGGDASSPGVRTTASTTTAGTAGTRSTRPTGQGVQASSASAVDAWVEKHGTKVSASAYGGTSTGGTLYYIGSAAASQ